MYFISLVLYQMSISASYLYKKAEVLNLDHFRVVEDERNYPIVCIVAKDPDNPSPYFLSSTMIMNNVNLFLQCVFLLWV